MLEHSEITLAKAEKIAKLPPEQQHVELTALTALTSKSKIKPEYEFKRPEPKAKSKRKPEKPPEDAAPVQQFVWLMHEALRLEVIIHEYILRREKVLSQSDMLVETDELPLSVADLETAEGLLLEAREGKELPPLWQRHLKHAKTLALARAKKPKSKRP